MTLFAQTLPATVFEVIIFGEPLKPLMIAGGALVIAGLIVGNLPRHLTEENPE